MFIKSQYLVEEKEDLRFTFCPRNDYLCCRGRGEYKNIMSNSRSINFLQECARWNSRSYFYNYLASCPLIIWRRFLLRISTNLKAFADHEEFPTSKKYAQFAFTQNVEYNNQFDFAPHLDNSACAQDLIAWTRSASAQAKSIISLEFDTLELHKMEGSSVLSVLQGFFFDIDSSPKNEISQQNSLKSINNTSDIERLTLLREMEQPISLRFEDSATSLLFSSSDPTSWVSEFSKSCTDRHGELHMIKADIKSKAAFWPEENVGKWTVVCIPLACTIEFSNRSLLLQIWRTLSEGVSLSSLGYTSNDRVHLTYKGKFDRIVGDVKIVEKRSNSSSGESQHIRTVSEDQFCMDQESGIMLPYIETSIREGSCALAKLRKLVGPNNDDRSHHTKKDEFYDTLKGVVCDNIHLNDQLGVEQFSRYSSETSGGALCSDLPLFISGQIPMNAYIMHVVRSIEFPTLTTNITATSKRINNVSHEK